MHQKAIVLLFLLFNTSFAFDTCYVLFVIDGSSYWPSFRGEMTSISTTGNLLYSSTAVYANANYWLYGDGDQDQPIPNWFYPTKQEFLDNVAEVQTNQGKETIVGATTKLNRWRTRNAVIVLYTASPQNLISIAGYNYTEQYRTVAIHLNDGVDMRPISDYPSPQMSEFGNILELVAFACRQLPTEGPSTPAPSTPVPFTLEPSTPVPFTSENPTATPSLSTSPCFSTQTTSSEAPTTESLGTTESATPTETPWETTDTTATTESFKTEPAGPTSTPEMTGSTGSAGSTTTPGMTETAATETASDTPSTTPPDCF